VIGIPLTALINGERVIGPDLSDDTWADLKLQHKKGLEVIMNCGAKGHLRISPNGLKHFYHAKKSDNCGCEPESYEHLKLKNQIYQICKSEGWDAQPEFQSLSGDWRADVFATNGERKVVFEVQLSIIPLCDLQERERKYCRDKIESYWILNDFLRIDPNDDSRVVTEPSGKVSICNYLNLAEFSLSRESFLHINHGIRSIGINLQNFYLYTSSILGINVEDWVISTLNRDYQKDLQDFEINYKRKCKLKEIVEPELDKLCDFGFRRLDYKNEMKKIYAIFKTHKWEDRPCLQQEINEMYSNFDTLKKAYGKIFSPKNGFIWKDFMDGEYSEPFLDLRSEEQISLIQTQIRNLETDEEKFLAVFNPVKEFVKKKNKLENNQTVEVFGRTVPQNEKSHESGIWNKLQNKPLQEKQIVEERILEKCICFEFNSVLPTLTIESRRGWKYQNPTRCKWEINQEDAIEFEKKGYGKIIQK